VTVLRFLPRPDVEGDPTESWTLEDSSIVASVWPAGDCWGWSVHRGRQFVENGLSATGSSARLESRRCAVRELVRGLGPYVTP
jgi:hypothetical protein